MKNELFDFCTFTEDTGISFTRQTYSCISLCKCINQVIVDLQSGTSEQNNTIINDVQKEMLVSTDKETLTTILTCLLNTMVINTQNNKIHLSAKLIGNITLMHIRSIHAAFSDEITESLKKTESLAERLGGCITISNNSVHGLTLAFTFINN
jgi:hypothetical protein